MRNRILVAASVILALTGCEMENDMMIPKDVAGYESFEVEDQVSSSINTSKLTVTVTMPAARFLGLSTSRPLATLT